MFLQQFQVRAAVVLIAVALVACSKHQDSQPSKEAIPAPPSIDAAASSAVIGQFAALEKAALAGDYQAQRNVAYWLSGGNSGAPPLDPVRACAWRLVILDGGDPQLDSSDVGNRQLYCDTRLDADGLRVAQAQAAGLLATVRASKGNASASPRLTASAPSGTVSAPAGSSEEALAMYQKVGDRLVFRTTEARRMVEEFYIPCPQAKDGRTLPLINVLIARLAQMDGKVVYVKTVVDSRGQEARIVDVVTRRADGRETDEGIALTMNAWGELRSGSINVEAVQNACYGSYGPIWVASK